MTPMFCGKWKIYPWYAKRKPRKCWLYSISWLHAFYNNANQPWRRDSNVSTTLPHIYKQSKAFCFPCLFILLFTISCTPQHTWHYIWKESMPTFINIITDNKLQGTCLDPFIVPSNFWCILPFLWIQASLIYLCQSIWNAYICIDYPAEVVKIPLMFIPLNFVWVIWMLSSHSF